MQQVQDDHDQLDLDQGSRLGQVIVKVLDTEFLKSFKLAKVYNTAKEAVSHIASLGSSLTFGLHPVDNMRLIEDGFDALAIAERLNNLVRTVASIACYHPPL